VGVSALAGTIAAPWTERRSGPGVAWWLRSAISLLAAVGILAIALPVAFGSGGARGADPVQVFSSGQLISVEAGGGAQLSIAGMVPGESRSATVRVANTGAASAAFSLAVRTADRVGAGGGALSDALILRIESARGAVLYSGPIGQVPRLGLGDLGAGAERAYRFAVTLPSEVGNEVEGAALSAGFAWTAT
jgi:hypothetical protein